MNAPSASPERAAAIDCGTNSLRMLVVEQASDGSLRELERLSTVVRLGEGVDATGRLSQVAMARTYAALDRYVEQLRQLEVVMIRCVATSAVRDATNREVFHAGVGVRLRRRLEVLDGMEEARLTAAGALADDERLTGPVLVTDVGGGSTELVLAEPDGRILAATSLDIGAVRLRERFLHADPPAASEVAAARAYVDEKLDHFGTELERARSWVSVAGTATTLAALHLGLQEYQRERVHRLAVPREEVAALLSEVRSRRVTELAASPVIPLGRAEVLCGGALVVDGIMRRATSCPAMIASEADILDALVAELFADRSTGDS